MCYLVILALNSFIWYYYCNSYLFLLALYLECSYSSFCFLSPQSFHISWIVVFIIINSEHSYPMVAKYNIYHIWSYSSYLTFYFIHHDFWLCLVFYFFWFLLADHIFCLPSHLFTFGLWQEGHKLVALGQITAPLYCLAHALLKCF